MRKMQKYFAQFFVALLMLSSSVSCSMAARKDEDVSVAFSPNAPLYNYFILVGMARGEIMVGHLKKHDLPTLLEIDKKARIAILQNMRTPSSHLEDAGNQNLIFYLSYLRQH